MTPRARSPVQILQSAWKRIAPLELADTSWDNVGVMIGTQRNDKIYAELRHLGDARATASASLAKLVDFKYHSLTTAVCEEALNMPDCSVIVSYHPPIFSGLKRITLGNSLQASLLRLSAKGISVFSPHTSLDSVPGGINTFLASPFQDIASSSKPIKPKFASGSEVPDDLAAYPNAGLGMLVSLQEGSELSVDSVVDKVKQLLGLSYVQLATSATSGPVKTLAFCAGSGSSAFKGCMADMYITGEMSHHEVLPIVAAGRSLIVCNHSNSERPYLGAVLKEWLKKELNAEEGEHGWEVVVSRTVKDPLETV